MGESPFHLDTQEPDLVLEPVIGWRVWRLRRDPDGVLVLESPLQALRWRPREPARARCHLTSTRGRSPHDG